MLVHAFSEGDLHLHELDSTEIEGSDRVQIKASLYSDKKRPAALETIVGKLSVEPGVTSARWQAVQTFV
jgi:putative Mg2+ transporter-C (MgtC) family protein